MSTKKEIEYKGIHFLWNKELNYLELIMDDKNIHDQTSYIITTGIMTEYCEKTKPKYLVFNKLFSDFVLTNHQREFTEQYVFSVLHSVGVRKFILLVNEVSEKYNFKRLVGEINDPYMIGFKSIDDMENWMRQQIVQN